MTSNISLIRCRKNKIFTSNSQECTKAEYQPGGTATVAMDKWVSQVCNSQVATLLAVGLTPLLKEGKTE
eukprot:5272811-Ditylum_brightwellii.AAC.1